MNIALWIIFGAIIGWLAAIFTNCNGTGRGHMNVLIGVAGAVVGGLLANIICQESITSFNIYSLLSAALAAVIALWLREIQSSSRMRG